MLSFLLPEESSHSLLGDSSQQWIIFGICAHVITVRSISCNWNVNLITAPSVPSLHSRAQLNAEVIIPLMGWKISKVFRFLQLQNVIWIRDNTSAIHRLIDSPRFIWFINLRNYLTEFWVPVKVVMLTPKCLMKHNGSCVKMETFRYVFPYEWTCNWSCFISIYFLIWFFIGRYVFPGIQSATEIKWDASVASLSWGYKYICR